MRIHLKHCPILIAQFSLAFWPISCLQLWLASQLHRFCHCLLFWLLKEEYRDRGREKEKRCVCVYVCECADEMIYVACICICVCVCVCEWEKVCLCKKEKIISWCALFGRNFSRLQWIDLREEEKSVRLTFCKWCKIHVVCVMHMDGWQWDSAGTVHWTVVQSSNKILANCLYTP